MIEIGLCCGQTLETQPLERGALGVADPAFDLSFSIRIANPARQRDGAIVRQHVAVQGIESGIVDIGSQHALAEIVEDDNACSAAEPAKGLFMQFGPDL